MEYIALSIVFFLCLYLGFREGIRLGQKVAKGEQIEPIRPMQTVQDFKENKEQTKVSKEIEEEYRKIMNYDGDIPKR